MHKVLANIPINWSDLRNKFTVY